MRSARPGFTLLLMLIAALAVLGGGVLMARRTVEDRTAADRTLLRETAAALQGETARLEAVYLDHLRRISGQLLADAGDEEISAAARGVRGLGFVSVVSGESRLRRSVRISGMNPGAPEPRLAAGSERPSFASELSVPPQIIFDERTEQARLTFDGWLPQTHPGWLVWWRRFDPRYAAVFVIREEEVRAAVAENLDALLDTVWLPVRAAGEAARVADRTGAALRSAGQTPDRPSDFMLPLTSRFGAWHVEGWDRRSTRVMHDQTTLTAAGLLALALAVLGAVVAAQQRNALREARAQVSFVNRVSHELGTPLTNLQLYLELARDSLPADAAGSERRLSIALEETARLSRLAGNVLTHARGGSGRLQLHPLPCRPAGIVNTVLEQFAPALTRRGITVETDLDDSLTIETDADALTQIAGNLISNVEKYAAAGEWMRIALHAQVSSSTWRLSVQDRGPGIPAAAAERIFLPFERLDSRVSEGITGTGLGLAIARDLARRMGGDVRLVPSQPGPPSRQPGAVFEAVLPLGRPQSALHSASEDRAMTPAIGNAEPGGAPACP